MRRIILQEEKYEAVIQVWELVKDFIPAKDRSESAEAIVSAMIEENMSNKDLIHLADHDHYLSDAWETLKEQGDLDEDLDYYNDEDDD